VPCELVAVASNSKVSDGLFKFTCALLFPHAPKLSSLLKDIAG